MQPHDNGYVVIGIENVGGIAYGEFLYVPPRLEDIPPGYITTVAGVGNYVRTFGAATSVSVNPGALIYDASGNLYVTEAGQHRVTRVDAAGNIHEFASGNFFTDNPLPDNVPAIGGGVAFPFGIAVGPGGNIYIGSHSPLLRMVDVRTGLIHNVAGNNHVGFGGDGGNGNGKKNAYNEDSYDATVLGFGGDGGPARDALTGQVTAVASDGTNVFFIDWDNTRIRRVDANGIITTYAGNGTIGYSGDGGPATGASFHFGTSDDGNLTVDPAGNLFVDDQANGAIRRIDKATGFITTFYTPSPGFSGADAVGSIRTITFDHDGNLHYGGAGKIVKVSAKGEFVTAYGPGDYVFMEDGPITPDTVRMGLVRSLTIDRDAYVNGNTSRLTVGRDLYVPNLANRVRRINVTTNRLETVAGIFPAYQNENGPAVAAPIMNDNMDLAIGHDGNLLIGDFRLRRLDHDGNLQTIAGGHPTGNFDNVPADNMINACLGIDVTSDGGIDLANTGDISHIDAANIVRRLGPNDANCGFDGDNGPFRNAHLCQMWDSARDAAGNLYIADTNNNRIRRVDAVTGIITTVAGNGGPVSSGGPSGGSSGGGSNSGGPGSEVNTTSADAATSRGLDAHSAPPAISFSAASRRRSCSTS